jgi:hypothetical protein
MSTKHPRDHQMFPVLDCAQIRIARRFASGDPRTFAPGECVFDVGELGAPVWLVLKGSIAVVRRDGMGREKPITEHGVGQFTGEVSQLAGRSSLAAGTAGDNGCTAVPIDAAHLRALVIGAADLGEIVMRALILRRVGLIEGDTSGSVLVGRPDDPHLVRLQGFLTRNGYPNTLIDAVDDAEGRELIERLGIHDDELPLMICPNGTVLKRPSDSEAAGCLGLTPELDPDRVYDVAIIGAGPAGLAASVYAASEGLSAPRRASKTTSVSRPASPGRHWPDAPTTRPSSSAPNWRCRSPSRSWTAAPATHPASPGSCRWPKARTCRRAPSSSPPARATAGRTSPTLRCSKAPAFPTGPHPWKRACAKARRSRWSAAATPPGRPSSSSRPR